MAKPLTIGFLANAANVSIETIRYYQRVGLIQEPPKPATGYRVYSTATIDRIKFIKRAQGLGFSLKEIAELLELGDGHCADVQHRAEVKKVQVEEQIRDLIRLKETLNVLIQSCQSDPENTHCPIVDTLTGY